MVDVAGGPERQRCVAHPPRSALRAAAITVSSSASDSVRGSSTTRPSWIRAITGGSQARSRAASLVRAVDRVERHRRPLELGQRQRAAARAGGASRSAPRARRLPSFSRRARAESRSGAASSIARTGSSDLARFGVAVERQRGLERRQRQLVDPQRAGKRVRSRDRDRSFGSPAAARPAGPRAACRPSSTRAPRRRPASAAGQARRSAPRSIRSLDEHPGAEVVDHRHPERAQLLDRGLFDEPNRPEVRLVDAQDRPDGRSAPAIARS